MTTLGTLLDGIVDERTYASRRNQRVTGIFDDSRRVERDGVFVALRGTSADGRRFVSDALSRGAALVIGEDLNLGAEKPVANVTDARLALARLASRWYGLETTPARARLKLLGVTGTNGKTTTAHMTREILRQAGVKCGLLGTVQNDLCGRAVTAEMTTPGPLQLAAMLRECVDAGATAAVLEVSSHALDQKRTDGLFFTAAAFTNLTQDHLDYHKTMDDYAAAKARMFSGLQGESTAILNRDDSNWERMAAQCGARIVTYGTTAEADISAAITRDAVGGTLYRMRIDGSELALENALVGRHNVYNAMAAAGLARAAGVPIESVSAGLNALRSVSGRLQRVPCVRGVDVFVDYAHTDDAIRNVARVLRPLARKRLIIVFGCGGDRDPTKRPKMAAAAAEFADAILVTSDNPRTEDPRAIIDQILAGFDAEARRRVVVESDRRAAIFTALDCAEEGDVVLIAGKGHETYQEIYKSRLPFDDVEVAIEGAAARERNRKGHVSP